jgi:SAM-dependent methyltransferase
VANCTVFRPSPALDSVRWLEEAPGRFEKPVKADKKPAGSAFWNENPCGTASSWRAAQELRFRYTDVYLAPLHQGPLLRERRVLEVGCGQGLDAERIVQVCRSYTGVDLSEASVEIARHVVDENKPPHVNTHWSVDDAEKLSFEDESFDAIYSIGVLHHTPDFEAALAEIHRVLEPGGVLVLMLYRSFNPLWLVLRSVRALLRLPVLGPRLQKRVVDSERECLRDEDSIGGTAMLELFGCPVIKTFTLRGMKRRFRGRFDLREHSFHRVGLEQAIRILPPMLREHWPQKTMERLESRLRGWLGFYMVLIAEKSAAAAPGGVE